MIKNSAGQRILQKIWRFTLQWTALFLLGLTLAFAAKPPKQLTNVIQHFLDMNSRSIEISQVIDWRFSAEDDSIQLQMDIQAGRIFHLKLDAFGMEIFVTENEMVTLNHSRQQILYENATPDALLKQLFVGGDLNEARFKREKKLEQGMLQLDFQFAGDFSDWESLSVIIDKNDDLKKIILLDYDGNIYHISLEYLPDYEGISFPDIQTDYSQYQIADLRDQ